MDQGNEVAIDFDDFDLSDLVECEVKFTSVGPPPLTLDIKASPEAPVDDLEAICIDMPRRGLVPLLWRWLGKWARRPTWRRRGLQRFETRGRLKRVDDYEFEVKVLDEEPIYLDGERIER